MTCSRAGKTLHEQARPSLADMRMRSPSIPSELSKFFDDPNGDVTVTHWTEA